MNWHLVDRNLCLGCVLSTPFSNLSVELINRMGIIGDILLPFIKQFSTFFNSVLFSLSFQQFFGTFFKN